VTGDGTGGSEARGVTDLAAMIATLEVDRRPGRYRFVTVAGARRLTELPEELLRSAEATVVEPEGVSVVIEVPDAGDLASDGFEAAWLTLRVHSALEAVGLTAYVSSVLAARGIACNVIAGERHDHLLVPADRAEEAVRALSPRP
jgi:hypothetical protein